MGVLRAVGKTVAAAVLAAQLGLPALAAAALLAGLVLATRWRGA